VVLSYNVGNVGDALMIVAGLAHLQHLTAKSSAIASHAGHEEISPLESDRIVAVFVCLLGPRSFMTGYAFPINANL
jgi:hypothetical protein